MDSTFHLNPPLCKRSLEKGRHKTEIASTPVILICIYNRNNSIISHNLIHSVFSPFGSIAKILIFEKGTVWKVFVEYKSTNAALAAKQALDDSLLMENGPKIKIYFSNLRKIKFQNGNTGGKAYEVQSEENDDSFYPGEREEAFGQEDESLWDADGFFRKEIKENCTLISLPTFYGLALKGISDVAEEEDKEDDIFHLINNLEEKEELEEAPIEEDLEEDPEKDGFNEVIMKAFNCASPKQKQANTSFDLKVWEQYVKNSSSDHGLSYCLPSLELIPRKSTNDESYSSIGGTHFPLSRCSTLSDLPVQGFPKLNPMSKVTSCEEISFTKRTPKRFHTAQALHSPMTNSEEIGLFRVNSAENSFLLETSNQGGQQQRNLQTTSVPFVLQKTLKECDGNKMNKHASNAPSTFQKNNNNNNSQEKPSQVLYVKGLENPEVTTQTLSNLFGNFGNIMKIILLRNKFVALIEFESIEHSTLAKNSLNNMDLMNNPLQITYSNYSTINLKGKRNPQEQEEIYIGNPKSFRLNRGKNFSVNPPSSTLHLFNLTKESCYEDQVRDFVQPFANVEKIKILSQDNTRNGCLVQLCSIEDSVNVLANLHEATLDGRKIQISFAHSKI